MTTTNEIKINVRCENNELIVECDPDYYLGTILGDAGCVFDNQRQVWVKPFKRFTGAANVVDRLNRLSFYHPKYVVSGVEKIPTSTRGK